MIGIYAITHIESGRSYVGSSISVERRFREHLKDLRAAKHFNPHLQHAWSLYGEDAFMWSLVEATEYEAHLPHLEQHYLDLRRPNVYNADGPIDCPWRGRKRSPEFCKKLGDRMRGKPRPHTPEQREKIVASNKSRIGMKMSSESVEKSRKANTGRKRAPFSMETKAKMSAFAKTRKYSPETREKMRLAKLGKKLAPFSTMRRANMGQARRLFWAQRKATA